MAGASLLWPDGLDRLSSGGVDNASPASDSSRIGGSFVLWRCLCLRLRLYSVSPLL